MSDNSWLLKPEALKAARSCIRQIQQDLGVRLPLTHQHFLAMLIEYRDLCDSEALDLAVAQLIPHLPEHLRTTAGLTKQQITAKSTERDQGFPSKKDGLEFKGMYRGNPTYG